MDNENYYTVKPHTSDLGQLCELSYQKYSEEVTYHNHLPMLPYADFEKEFALTAEGMDVVIATENGKTIGFLLYSVKNQDGVAYCNIPLYGYYADTVKTLDRLFSCLAERIVIEETQFSVHLYAHDLETQRIFSFLQFYMMSEKCIRVCGKAKEACEAIIRRLGKDELICRWDEVWAMVKKIIEHLQSSPVFYPGNEFTEEVYREFLPECNVYVAEVDGRLIGMIESNDEKMTFPFANINAVNMGEIYLDPEYRGRGIAKALLYFAEKDQNCKTAWVEHGTANPNARAFWNRHFEPYEYLMIRQIQI